MKSSVIAESLSTESAAVTHGKTHKEMVTKYIKHLAHTVSCLEKTTFKIPYETASHNNFLRVVFYDFSNLEA